TSLSTLSLHDALPISLRRFELAIIDQIVRAQPFFGIGGLARGLQFSLRREEIVMDAELGEVGADHVHHRADRLGAKQAEPGAFRSEEHTSELQSRENL